MCTFDVTHLLDMAQYAMPHGSYSYPNRIVEAHNNSFLLIVLNHNWPHREGSSRKGTRISGYLRQGIHRLWHILKQNAVPDLPH